jgi:hypothetical protein
MELVARLALAWIVLAIGPIAWISDRGIGASETLSPASMTLDGDFALYAAILPPPFFETRPDSNGQPTVSQLRLFENGLELGPAHALGTTVKSAGHGAFSHWASHVYFSSSDGTDPRTNGRNYTARFRVYLTWAGQAAALLGLPGLIAAAAAMAAGMRLLLRRELSLRHAAKPAANRGSWLLQVVRGTLDSPRVVLQTSGLILAYSVAMVLICDSLAVRERAGGSFKINFEYKVF